jgi:hypothetical protein
MASQISEVSGGANKQHGQDKQSPQEDQAKL